MPVKRFQKPPSVYALGGANHKDFSVVNHPPPPGAYQGHCMKRPLLWLTHPYICDGLLVLRY